MTDDRSGKLTLWYIRFGAFMTLALIIGTFVYKLAGGGRVEIGPPETFAPFSLTASDFQAFVGETVEPEAPGALVPAALEGGLERPLRIAGPRRASLAPALALASEPTAPVQVEWVRIDDRVERYEALQRGEVDLIWETLPGLAEALHRLQLVPLPARVVAFLGQSRGTDALVGRAVAEGVSPLQGQRLAVEAFSPAHFLYLHRLAAADMPAEAKAEAHAKAILTGRAGAAVQRWNDGAVRILGSSEPTLPSTFGDGPPLFRMDTSTGLERIDELLLAHPSLLEKGPGSVAALVAAWMEQARALSAEPPRGLELLVGGMGLDEEEAARMLEGVAFAGPSRSSRFFGGEGAARLDAAQRIWQRVGVLREPLPAADWLDARFQPQRADAARAP